MTVISQTVRIEVSCGCESAKHHLSKEAGLLTGPFSYHEVNRSGVR